MRRCWNHSVLELRCLIAVWQDHGTWSHHQLLILLLLQWVYLDILPQWVEAETLKPIVELRECAEPQVDSHELVHGVDFNVVFAPLDDPLCVLDLCPFQIYLISCLLIAFLLLVGEYRVVNLCISLDPILLPLKVHVPLDSCQVPSLWDIIEQLLCDGSGHWVLQLLLRLCLIARCFKAIASAHLSRFIIIYLLSNDSHDHL